MLAATKNSAVVCCGSIPRKPKLPESDPIRLNTAKWSMPTRIAGAPATPRPKIPSLSGATANFRRTSCKAASSRRVCSGVATRPPEQGPSFSWQIGIHGLGLGFGSDQQQEFVLRRHRPQPRREVLRALLGAGQDDDQRTAPRADAGRGDGDQIARRRAQLVRPRPGILRARGHRAAGARSGAPALAGLARPRAPRRRGSRGRRPAPTPSCACGRAERTTRGAPRRRQATEGSRPRTNHPRCHTAPIPVRDIADSGHAPTGQTCSAHASAVGVAWRPLPGRAARGPVNPGAARGAHGRGAGPPAPARGRCRSVAAISSANSSSPHPRPSVATKRPSRSTRNIMAPHSAG